MVSIDASGIISGVQVGYAESGKRAAGHEISKD
jgi:hypothetical protein